MSEFPRPRCCPDERCRPIFQTPAPSFLVESADDPRRRDDVVGSSWFCWGMMPAATEFVYAGEHHRNDLSTCVCTPLKGVIRFQENAADWWLMRRGYHKALARLEQIEPLRLTEYGVAGVVEDAVSGGESVSLATPHGRTGEGT